MADIIGPKWRAAIYRPSKPSPEGDVDPLPWLCVVFDGNSVTAQAFATESGASGAVAQAALDHSRELAARERKQNKAEDVSNEP